MNYQQLSSPHPQHTYAFDNRQKYPYMMPHPVNMTPQFQVPLQFPAQGYNILARPQFYPSYIPTASESIQNHPQTISNEYYPVPMQTSYAPIRYEAPKQRPIPFEIEESSINFQQNISQYIDSTESNINNDDNIQRKREFGALSCVSAVMSALNYVWLFVQIFTMRFDLHSSYDLPLQECVLVAIMVLTALKVPVYAAGSLGVKKNSLNLVGIFVSYMLAHMFLMITTLFMTAIFCPWISRVTFVIYMLVSFIETIWFLPAAFALKTSLEESAKRKNLNISQMTV